MQNDFDSKVEEYDIVDYSRIAGRAIYESYSSADISDPGWSFREDGTIDDHTHGVEITPQGDIFGQHRDVKEFLKSSELTGERTKEVANFESHHLIPVEVLDQVGIHKDDGISVAVDWHGHMKDIHGYGGLQQNLLFADVNEMKNYYSCEYRELGAPEWAIKADEFVEKNRETIEEGLENVAEHFVTSGNDLSDPLSSPRIIEDADESIEEPPDQIESHYIRDRIK